MMFSLSLSSSDILIILIAFSFFLMTYLALNSFTNRLSLQKKMRELTQGEPSSTASKSPEARSLIKTIISKVYAFQQWVGKPFKKSSSKALEAYKNIFEQAGWDVSNAIPVMILSKVTLIIIAFLCYSFMLYETGIFDGKSPTYRLGVLIGMALVASLGYDYFIKYKVSARYASIRRDLSSALDLLVICARSGLSIDKSFEQVAQEIGRYSPHLGKELALTSIELSLLPNRRTVFENLARRVKMTLIQALATTLIQAEEQGTALSDTLTNLSEEFRTQTILAAEAKAGRLPAVLSIPIVLFTLPSLLIVIIGPAFANISKSTLFH